MGRVGRIVTRMRDAGYTPPAMNIVIHSLFISSSRAGLRACFELLDKDRSGDILSYATCMSPLLCVWHVYVICMSFLLFVCHLYVMCMACLCYLYVTFMLCVWHLYVICMSPLCYVYVIFMLYECRRIWLREMQNRSDNSS